MKLIELPSTPRTWTIVLTLTTVVIGFSLYWELRDRVLLDRFNRAYNGDASAVDELESNGSQPAREYLALLANSTSGVSSRATDALVRIGGSDDIQRLAARLSVSPMLFISHRRKTASALSEARDRCHQKCISSILSYMSAFCVDSPPEMHLRSIGPASLEAEIRSNLMKVAKGDPSATAEIMSKKYGMRSGASQSELESALWTLGCNGHSPTVSPDTRPSY